MDGDREPALLADLDQWARCRHENTALIPGRGVQLTWDDESPGTTGTVRPDGTTVRPDGTVRPEGTVRPAGLAFDRWGRAYRSRPAEDRIDVIRDGETVTLGGCRGLFDRPRGLAVDDGQLLYVAEGGTGAGRVTVHDVWADRVLRRIPLGTRSHRRTRTVDVVAVGDRAYVLMARPARILVCHGRRGPLPGPRPSPPRCRGPLTPLRIAARPDGTLLLLWRRPGTPYSVVTTVYGDMVAEAAGATDLTVTADGTLFLGLGDGQPFPRHLRQEGDRTELEPVDATGYDGGAVAAAPDGSVAFTTARGIGRTGGPAARHRATGRVVTYRLDSGAYRTRWGRLFLDACIPPRTEVRAGFLTGDDDEPPADALPWQPADRGSFTIRRPDLTPPLPSMALLDAVGTSDGFRPLLRRPTGRETPWAQIPANDRYETYESPVAAPPGRYLWVVLELSSGTVAATPRVRALRVERPGHQLLRQLPRAWSRGEGDADFLQRFLAPAEGMLHELDERAARRDVLVDPVTVPQEALTWLAGFAGLVLDRRWPESARRALVASAYRLFRRRGTPGSLAELVGMYLGREPAVIEQWRLRGLPGGLLRGPAGPDPDDPAAAVLGRMRVGGTTGRTDSGTASAVEDGYRTAAHRFTVLVHDRLSAEQLGVVRAILDLHKPAHTVYEICESGSGMRVGSRLHLGLTSVVGPGARWGPAVVGRVALGGDGVVGVPATGARVHETSVVGEVRVG
ncbi:phage tail protein [Streptomyces sp. NPDC007940]|uniref:phage tail protein n=1 Tax=Streptomyces sp. NPDC007940 TaxID=3364796 RepID=UPI0036F0D933